MSATRDSRKPNRLEWLSRREPTLEGTHYVFAPARRSFRISVATLEQLLVLTRLGISLALLSTILQSYTKNIIALAGSITWSYIFALNLLRNIIFIRDKVMFRTLWLHAAVLNHLQWISTLVITRSIIILNRSTSSGFWTRKLCGGDTISCYCGVHPDLSD